MSGVGEQGRRGEIEQVRVRPIVVPVIDGVDARKAVEAAAHEAADSGREVLLLAVVEMPKSMPKGFAEYARTEWRGEEPRWLYVRLAGEQLLKPHIEYLKERGMKCEYLVETPESVGHALTYLPVEPAKVIVQLVTNKKAKKAVGRLIGALGALKVPILITP
ncbi:MAG: hypothetical protein NZ957_05615 [Thaumarchaeota archaeon]|nr:hypothetical protein [Candidatus Calditenuaceae archaeon]MDW8041484.1 hypothetical protein [Nitrososphaerota archaeon]